MNNATIIDAGQQAIVMTIKGNDYNHNFTSLMDITRAISLASYATKSVGSVGAEVNQNTPLSSANIQLLKNELATGRWVVGVVYVKGSAADHHVIVIKSYNASTDKFTFYEQWWDKEYTFSTADITNGTIKNTAFRDAPGCYLRSYHYCK